MTRLSDPVEHGAGRRFLLLARRAMNRARSAVLAVVVMGFPVAAPAQTGPVPAPPAADAPVNSSLSDDLAAAEQTLARAPGDVNALFQSALINLKLGNLEAARSRAERLVSFAGSSYQALELIAQITQGQGDLARRDEAIRRLPAAIRSAIDPEIRRRNSFIRERIRVPGEDVLAAQYYGGDGPDFTRYLFFRDDPKARSNRGLMLRTDAATTEIWSTTALLPTDQQLFHLDMVDADADGREKVGIYQYYAGEPDYDTVRVMVLRILRGEVQPLSGEPGSMAGILK